MDDVATGARSRVGMETSSSLMSAAIVARLRLWTQRRLVDTFAWPLRGIEILKAADLSHLQDLGQDMLDEQSYDDHLHSLLEGEGWDQIFESQDTLPYSEIGHTDDLFDGYRDLGAGDLEFNLSSDEDTPFDDGTTDEDLFWEELGLGEDGQGTDGDSFRDVADNERNTFHHTQLTLYGCAQHQHWDQDSLEMLDDEMANILDGPLVASQENESFENDFEGVACKKQEDLKMSIVL